MMMTSQSFPVGKYARYKRATAFFLNWLARAGRRERGGNNLQLETFNDVVEEILANPSTLTTELLQECSKALAACQYAIELREHVASFFSEHDEGQASHQHFVELLRNWHRALKSVVMGRSKTIVQLEISERENYYEVLEVDDEYLPDEDSFSTAKQLPKATKVDRNPVLQEAFADGMKVEVVCFFSELDELMQGVCKAYGEVKREERTLVEATVVAKLAMDSASALTAQLQLKYPALRTSEDMYNVVRNIDPVKFRHRMATIHTKYLTDLQDSLLNGDGAVPYVPGMFLMDFLGVGTTLASFLTALPIDTTKSLEVPTGCFGEVYSEDRTPHYVLLPDPSKMNVFLLQQLPLLHKTIMEKKVTTGSGHDSSAPMESFMVLMEKYFTCREVTVPVVFTCICWIKSVAALQGDVGLGRNVSLTFRHSTELMRNIKETVAKGTVRKAHNKSNNLLQLCADEIKRSTGRRYLSRANPLLAGLTMLDHHFKYLHMASEILLVTSRFRSFGHVYNALVKEGYLEQISSLDDLLEVYSEMIFTPSRDAATRGSYYRTLLLSVDLRSASVDALCRGEGLPAGNEKFKKRKVLHLSDVSDTYRLMVRNDKSGLNRSSWASILDDAANICSKELSQTRVLSRDLLKLNDELANVYVELCAELKEGDWYGQTITDTGADLIEQQKMEDGVIMILLQLLDGLQSDHGGPDFGGPVDMCKKAAAVIRKTFSTSSTVRSEKIFTILSRPDFISQEFDLKSDKSRVENDNCEQIFFKLMKLLQGSNGPLSKSDRSFIKAEIKKNSGLLGMIEPTPACLDTVEDSTNALDDNRLCTLLHQAAAGSAHDAELVEWMIQMGALALQPTFHGQKQPQQNDVTCSKVLLSNAMAVHSAARAGYGDIVQILLEADQFADLNTPTLHTKETLAHLAVKHGHRRLFNTLVWFGADLLAKDRGGRCACAMTADADWARGIAAYSVRLGRTPFNSVGKRDDCLEETERRRKLAAIQSDEQDLISTPGCTSPNIQKRSRKRSSKKKMRSGKTSVVEATPSASGGCPLLDPTARSLHYSHTSAHLGTRCY
ncbi:Ankyrin repeats domain-containing protein [Phytophthora infestans]|uniref:Ankyrin repeats domain-containing protein n=1 Tax=Phytophthora infestans TaxID=4787 RepID=A0A8S9V9R3_PHYIN|nr:Ankyrin repeats domain-containing protein [Phytophthora infestans]